MGDIKLTINGREVQVPAGTTILEAAKSVDVYIPTLCFHPDVPPAMGSPAAEAVYQGARRIKNARPEESRNGCGLCLVEVEGEDDLVPACGTPAAEGMVVRTESDRIREMRQENLMPILARHPHSCLTCTQQEGCSRSHCSADVPENERCCSLFGHCELQDVANYVGIPSSTPKWSPTNLPVLDSDPLYIRDYNLCIGCTRCVRACRDLRGIEALGFVCDEKGKIQVGTLAPTLEDSGCRFCTACVEVCPTGALTDRNVRPGKKEADLVPCKAACPAHIDVPSYLRLVSEGKRSEANAVIREKVPFPGVLGRVCPRPCEEACRRGEVNEPVSICSLKRYAADGDRGPSKRNLCAGQDTDKRVAVVGAGPAGLTAAFYLRKKGHRVTVFEARQEPGGMLRYGIPAFRLPREVLEREIRDVLDLGVDLRTNECLGKDFSLDHLEHDGFNAVFLAVGAQLTRKIDLEGSELPDVLWGVDFLREVSAGKRMTLKDRVIVIGGGNAAVDVARTALRCGASRVIMAFLESLEEMPAHAGKIQSAVNEGVELLPSRGPRRILSDSGRVAGVELVPCISRFDAKGSFCPAFGEAKEIVEGDQVILAVGQAADFSFLDDEESPIRVRDGIIVVNPSTLETDREGVYAGGDAAAAPRSVIHAISSGREAASGIDRALGGDGDIRETLVERSPPDPWLGPEKGFASRPREKMPELESEKRKSDFQEVAQGYGDEQAKKEAGRCLQCDLRLFISSTPSPLAKWMPFNEKCIGDVPESEGVYQLFGGDHHVLAIKGTASLRRSLLEDLEEYEAAVWFVYEEHKMYSLRESELIQKYLREHGEMPGCDADLDELF